MEAGFNILAHIGSTMRKFNIRILPGDSVKIELSPFDISRGKIIKREN
jgi:translation initiation factor IF-1